MGARKPISRGGRYIGALLAWPVGWYIRRQRDRLVAVARPLTVAEREPLRGYFGDSDLDRVLIAELDELPLPDARLARLARSLGWSYPGSSSVAAITFDNLVATRVPLDSALLFHELVHVVQWQHLGPDKFIMAYALGHLLSGVSRVRALTRFLLRIKLRVDGDAVFDVRPVVRVGGTAPALHELSSRIELQDRRSCVRSLVGRHGPGPVEHPHVISSIDRDPRRNPHHPVLG